MEKRRSNLVGRGMLCLLTLLCLSFTAFSQTRTVTGRVTGSTDNLPLPGVTITVKGTSVSKQSADDGTFSIDVPANATALTFSAVGYESQDVVLGSSTTINIDLAVSNKSLESVVVVGYGTLKRKEITSAVASVRPDDFRQSGARNALDVAQGKVAGLQITRTGGTNPNSGVNIQIRGINSLSAGTSPLIVIDGIPGGNLDLLQQDDIESIDVLKDGSAAAIYGTRGNGGVILINTKKGKAGVTRYDYNGYARKEFVARKPEFYSAAELRELIASGKLAAARDNPAWGGVTTNMFDEVLNDNNITQYHNLAISGGTRNSSYRASMFYQDLQGIALENGRKNYGGRLNINHRGFNDKLTTMINVATNFNKANLLGGGNWETILTRLPTQPIYNPDGTFYEDPATTSSANQVSILNQEMSKRDQQTSSLDVKFTLDLFKGFKASMFGALQRDMYVDNAYKDIASRSSQVGNTNGVQPNGTGYAYKGSVNNNNYAFEPTIEYSTVIKDNHSINAIAGYSYRYEVNESSGFANSGYVNDLYENNNMGAGVYQLAQRSYMASNKNDNTLIAFFGRVNYSFNDKYYAQAIFRREGSSRFGTNNKWANFPALSAGWNLSKENFMESVSFVDNLKLRVGYGATGNTGFSNYASLVTLSGGGFYLYPDGVWRQTYGPSRNPNPNLRWEKKKEINIGLDFGLFKNRLTGSIEVYQRRTEDLLETYDSQLPAFITTSVYANVGTIENKGIELTLSGDVVRSKNFTWSMDIAASTQRNRMVSFSNDIYKGNFKEYGGIGGYGALGNAIRTVEGGPLGSFYGKRFAGFDATGQWLFYKRDGKTTVTFDKINTSNDPNTTDLAVLGNGIPKFYTSWTNQLRYKGFDLRLFFRGKFDYQILNLMDMAYANRTTPTNLLKNTFGKHAQLNNATGNVTYQYSDYYLENGSYLKLDEVTIAYNFKLKTSYVKNLRVYFSGSNIATITSYTGNDPDFVNDTGLGAGLDGRGPYPSTRSFLVGVNLGF
ncbi:SusC/RagA family TonB-linked outer membrane protein [Paraflavitalea pollutisoli]|uniref:SusC/RagA family TonB-linked outer membrane protein n=1 Tax=Paraflavitalea pollutisoli TaxID=3034143 RepID=UPI0023EA8E60|nr:SusC/RagA family TonB-linked outer membrane protein [Paraflavitalea sp. H1-2-19X]